MPLRFCSRILFLAAACLLGGDAFAQETPKRVPVHPRHNVEVFAPLEAKWLRFTVLRTTSFEPCLDELEIYGPGDPTRNLALASDGARARASGTLPAYRIHVLSHVNDGLYGNGHSWIGDTVAKSWVEIELPAPALIDRVVWSRDREGKFVDRLAIEYRIEVAREPDAWQLVASSADRLPLSMFSTANPGLEGFFRRVAPAATDLSGPARPAAREYVVQTWETSQGLPANTVTALAQTRDGWLWVGTSNGLARFDGLRFSVFGESHGLTSLSISCLLEDSDGRLWIGTEGGGLARWENGRFLHVPIGDGTRDKTVLALAEGSSGDLWVGTLEGLFELADGKFTLRAAGIVTGILADPEGGVWFLQNNRLERWNGRKVKPLNTALDPGRFTALSALAAGPDGALWFGGANGYVARWWKDEVETFGEGQPALASNLWTLLPTRGGDVWLGTSASGLARLRGREWLTFTTEDGFPLNSLRALCEDREGNLWVGTNGGGLVRLSQRRVASLTSRDGLSHNVIMALAEDAAGTAWIGTAGGGLNRWQGGKVAPFAPSYFLENQVVSSLAATADGTLWAGASGSGLFRIEDTRLEQIPIGQDFPRKNIVALSEDMAGGLWIGTLDRGVAYLFEGRITRPPALAPLANAPITAITVDRAGRVWFGTAGQGAARLESGRLTRWTRGEGLASDFIRTLHEDEGGTLWAGTNGGLTRWREGTVESFTLRHGLPDAVISQVLDDRASHLWLGTNRGILRVPHRSFDAVASRHSTVLDVLALDASDGLPSLECTGGAGLRTRDGRLCFGTVAGLAVVDPAAFAAPAEPPPVVVEEVTIGTGEPRAPGSGSLHVPADAGRVAFRFTALSYTAPERVRFRYRMEGLDKSWAEAGGQREAIYSHLPPGEYRFHVVASRDGGQWSEAGAEVSLRVLAPWWREPWALALGVLASVAGVAGGARFVMQRRLRAVEQQFALERERSRIAQDIHDDLGANLTQIALLSAIGREHRDQPAVVEERFTAIAATASALVQDIDAIVWAVNPRHDTLESFARYLTSCAESLFAHGSARLRLDVPVELPDAALHSEVRHHLFLAAKEALNNALRHAAASEVRLRLATEAGRFTLRIEDDGRGFTPGATGCGGDGLGNMQRRLVQCDGTCAIESSPGHGTCVTLSVPIP